MDVNDIKSLNAEIKKRFPNVELPNTPITEQAGQEMYVVDPDGTSVEFHLGAHVPRLAAGDVDRIHALVSRARVRELQAVARTETNSAPADDVPAQLIDIVQELAAAEQQMTAVAALCQQLTRERVAPALLPSVVEAIAAVTGAEYTVAGWLMPDGTDTGHRAAIGQVGDVLSRLRDAALSAKVASATALPEPRREYNRNQVALPRAAPDARRRQASARRPSLV